MPRFTIRNLLTATFWLCLWFVALRNFPTQPRSGLGVAVSIASWFYIIAGPFTVLGALAGETVRGFAFGAAVAVGLTLFIMMVGYMGMLLW